MTAHSGCECEDQCTQKFGTYNVSWTLKHLYNKMWVSFDSLMKDLDDYFEIVKWRRYNKNNNKKVDT